MDRPSDSAARAGEREPVRAGEAAAPLRGLLELSRLTRSHPSPLDTLRAVAQTVSEALRFRTVAVNAFRPETDDYEVVAVHGNERARETLLGDVTPTATWEPLLDARFLRHGVYLVPAGEINYDPSVRWYVPELPGSPATRSELDWHEDDALFAPLDGAAGLRFGIISLDEPITGLRPTDAELEVLSALAAHAALAVESSLQLTALEAALARNRALIQSTLDCVIAVDESIRVIEFNPAAERAFGRHSADVLGRDAAELLVAPALREVFRSFARRARENPDSTILGRRIETSALRGDGSEFPVEVTVTRVPGGVGEGPFFYAFLRDIAERRRSEEQLSYLAYHDALTDLPNRTLVEREMDLALARARRADGSAALLFIDLDDFKEVNDRLGHAAGDRLLASIAARLRGVLRDTDVLARQGGDEFLVLLADLQEGAAATAEQVAGKLLHALREPFVVSGVELRTGASIGISLYPDDASDTEVLLRHADAAMYRAKAGGGGRWAVHKGGAISNRRAGITSEVRAAITAGELELHYQPVFTLAGERQMTSVEALLRWRHPERGLLCADAFVPLAEQTSAGDELMDWVMRECFRQAREWQFQDGLTPLIGLNVSASQLLVPGFVARLSAAVRSHGLSPVRFAIELTESAWTVDATETLVVIEELRAAGFVVALDDFGAGYSSLSRLGDLGFDVIKIDGRMLVDVPSDPIAVRLLEAALAVAAACGTDVVAEGVDSEAQLQFLISRGVRRAQGTHLCEALTPSRLTPLLRRQLITEPLPDRAERANSRPR